MQKLCKLNIICIALLTGRVFYSRFFLSFISPKCEKIVAFGALDMAKSLHICYQARSYMYAKYAAAYTLSRREYFKMLQSAIKT